MVFFFSTSPELPGHRWSRVFWNLPSGQRLKTWLKSRRAFGFKVARLAMLATVVRLGLSWVNKSTQLADQASDSLSSHPQQAVFGISPLGAQSPAGLRHLAQLP